LVENLITGVELIILKVRLGTIKTSGQGAFIREELDTKKKRAE